MIKTKKLKISLLMGVITCFVAVFCCIQTAFANDVNSDDTSLDCSANFSVISESEKPIIGAVRGAYDGFFFRDEKEFEVACFGYEDKDYLKNEKELTIYVHKNFNFHEFTCEIDNNRTFKFVIDQAVWLFSTDAHTMINVKDGNLILNCKPSKTKSEEEDYHAFVSEPGKHTAITVDEGGQVQADHIWFREPYEGKEGPSEGGVFYFDDITKDSSFNNCIFDHNKASNGGAVYVNSMAEKNKTILFNSCKFQDCSATNKGGVIYNDAHYTKIKFQHCNINNCSSHNEGGVIVCHGNYQDYTFDNTLIDNCSSETDDGGAIYIHGCDCNFTGTEKDSINTSKISNCKAHDDGGAIFSTLDSNCGNNIHITNLDFESNHAYNDGGALKLFGRDQYIDKCNFTKNKAVNQGGAISFTTGSFPLGHEHGSINNCVFDDNFPSHNCSEIFLGGLTDLVSSTGNKICYYEPIFNRIKHINKDDNFLYQPIHKENNKFNTY